ncbi:MAG: cobalt-precorrin 5A hydrolase [Desulfobacterales bacterium]|nr:cobalt-precorrin 5A hydrolase [Desulfobacterales bacterium]
MTETSAMGTENNSGVRDQGAGIRGYGSRVAIICLTRGGVELAMKLKGLLPNMKLYAYKPLDLQLSNLERFSSLPGLIEKIWSHHNALIFIMAAGIVVRTIAPLIKDKKADPAVVVLDEKGRFAISLLSGHMGGANRLAKEVADFLGGQAVITTASDVNERPALDLCALERDLYVEDWEKLKRLSARIVNGENIKVFTDGVSYDLPEEFIPVKAPEDAQIIITNRIMSFPALYLRPRNLVLGIGCNRGTEAEEIEEAVKDVFGEWGFSPNSIRNAATVDKKRDEAGLLCFAERHGLNIEFFSPEELNRVKGINGSPASMRAIGARGVAEPAAMLAARSSLLIPKQKRGNVTLAVASFTLWE